MPAASAHPARRPCRSPARAARPRPGGRPRRSAPKRRGPRMSQGAGGRPRGRGDRSGRVGGGLPEVGRGRPRHLPPPARAARLTLVDEPRSGDARPPASPGPRAGLEVRSPWRGGPAPFPTRLGREFGCCQVPARRTDRHPPRTRQARPGLGASSRAERVRGRKRSWPFLRHALESGRLRFRPPQAHSALQPWAAIILMFKMHELYLNLKKK